ncbi:hypothetical protein EJ07DRAFT_153664 [Lizonia empirigonia]|nr:hypothetical protein EJ07DRAFT_153664 [Lizonia empirigonia]
MAGLTLCSSPLASSRYFVRTLHLKMDIHHHMPDEVVDTETTPAPQKDVEIPSVALVPTRDPVAIQYSRATCPKKFDVLTKAQHLGALEAAQRRQDKATYLKSRAELKEEQAFYHVEPEEWEAVHERWREWTIKRPDGADPLDPERFFEPSDKAPWQEREAGAPTTEKYFSRVLEAKHDDCRTCEAVRITEENATLTETEQSKRKANFEAHEVPLLKLPSTDGYDAEEAWRQLKKEEYAEVHDSAWGHERSDPTRKTAKPSFIETLERSMPKSEIFEPREGTMHGFRDRSDYFDGTRQLLQFPDEKARLHGIMHDPDLVVRAKVFGRNERTVKKAIDAAEPNGLSTVERKFIARTIAEVWELERDLVRLESMQRAVKIRRKWAQKGYSCGMIITATTRAVRFNMDVLVLLMDHLLTTKRKRRKRKKGGNKVLERRKGKAKTQPLNPQEQQLVETSAQSRAVDRNDKPERSVSPLNLTQSPEQLSPQEEPQQVRTGPSIFLNTLQNFRKHALETAHEDNISPSTEGDPFKYDAAQQPITTTGETAIPDTEVAANSASKSQAKKDSKVEGLMEEDGVSPKDFATKSEGKIPKILRKLSFKGRSSRRG